MSYFGNGQKALELADRGIALDPLQALSHFVRAVSLYELRDYAQAIAAYRAALELAPKLSTAHTGIGYCLTLMNRPAEAKAEYKQVPPHDPLRLTGEAILAGRSRDLAGVEAIVSQMRKLFGAAESVQYAQIYAQAGNANRAFAELDNGFVAMDTGLLELNIDPFLDPIRSDPRFAALLKRLNFPMWS